MKSRLAAGLLLVLWGMSFADSLVLGGVAPAGPTEKSRIPQSPPPQTRMPPKYLKVSAQSPSTVLLVWRLGVRPDMQWVVTERYNILLKQWTQLDVANVANEAIRYEHGGLQGSTQYRFTVCGYVKEANGNVSKPCTNPTTIRTPVALDSRGATLIEPRIPPVFVISAITPAATGFHLCAGLTGLVGRFSGGTIKPSDLSSSICAPGNVTITQTNPKVNMMGQKIRLFAIHEAYDGFDYNSTIAGYPRTDVYELVFANNNSVTFQVAFASGRGKERRPQEIDYVRAHFGTVSWPLSFTAQYQGSGDANSSCSYRASPVAVSCNSPQPTLAGKENNLGQSQQPLIVGNTVTAQEQALRGLVSLNGTSCSGVLIANDWVMTAGHCVRSQRPLPAAETVTLNGVNRTSDAIYQFGGGLDNNGRFLDSSYGPDLALVHLSQPFAIAGSTTNFSNRLYAGSAASLNGKIIATYGQGISIYAQPGTPPIPPQGAGVWRAADLTVSAVSGGTYTIGPNSQTQITAFGDSGGPGFIWDNNTPYITGIQSRSVPVCNNTTPITCQQTVTGITSSTVTSVPAAIAWIAAVLKTQWHPTVTSEPIWVQSAEITGTKSGFNDANNVGWAQAARAAAAMCYNRGFVSGHFDGHQDVAKGGYGIQCSGTGATWYDMSAAAMDTRWKFADVNSVSWAQANRVAERYCATQNQGFAGGHFNGHMAPGIGLVPARYGLTCYKNGAQWFDATDAQIAATGFGFSTPRLDEVLWAQAARAAVGFCRAMRFSGGFMNGHQVPGKYGVVCQK